MKTIVREIEKKIITKLPKGKVIVILGPRRVGKTFLINQIISKVNEEYLLINGEDLIYNELLQKRSIASYGQLMGNKKLLIIDEAQKIQNIGSVLKLMIDNIEGIKIIATGSSSFDLSNRTGEPLTGRQYIFYLYPFSQSELNQYENFITTNSMLTERLVYGSYPEIVLMKDRTEKKEYLLNIVNSYLMKDLLELENLKSSEKLYQMLKLLAFQTGSQVSFNEISLKVRLSVKTVERYLDLLSKVFVIFRLGSFSRNLRKEITRSSKYYFYDNGIRNALINNFNDETSRDDTGKLWENYLVSERIKYQSYNYLFTNNYFWRTYDKQEIDWIEEKDGKISAYEFKYSDNRVKIPGGWKNNYPDSEYRVITKNNYLDFIT